MAGLTIAGFEIKTLQDIKREITLEIRDKIDSSFNGTSDTQGGRLIDILSEREAILWEIILDLYTSIDPNFAEGARLDSIMSLVGIYRKQATQTRVNVLCELDALITLPANTRVNSTNIPDIIFYLKNEFTSESAGYYLLEFLCENYGAIPIFANQINNIVDSITGFNGVVNPTDGILGSAIETDTEMLKRRNNVVNIGSGSLLAIQTAILQINGVKSCTILENNTSEILNQIPPFSYECIIDDGNNTNNNGVIADTIFQKTPVGGGQTYGSISVNVDFNSNTQTKVIKFSRPDLINYYLDIDVFLGSNISKYTVNDLNTFNSSLKSYIVEKLNGYGAGSLITISKIICMVQSFSTDIVDVSNIKIDYVNPPVNTSNVQMQFRQKAVFATNRTILEVT